ncbi:Glyoxylate reductase/hydroxypyruvate reductase [Rhynchospora pubera]|uniref:Glyoxylate reductase/hydroxypyruvate reductase n=1 Tax=Rhynchospora pubera TaxID=906938 RepID=A0AAV8CW72_9POAL|nr:Glyoxylate reductase/hydroxypyruvate reductase [Rhynchospora pubera]
MNSSPSLTSDGATNTITTSNKRSSSDLPPLLVLRPLSDAWSAALSAKFTVISPSSPLSTSTRAALVSAAYNKVDPAFLDQYPSLQCIATTSIGVDHIDLEECWRRGIQVETVGEIFTKDVADYAVGLLIDVSRRITMSDRYVQNGLWMSQGDYPLGSKLGGKHVGIVGLGSIGSAIARRLEAFGCKISYVSRKPKPTVKYKYIPNIYDLATESDILVVACSLTKETHHIINKQVLQALGKEGIVINIGRGANIDEPELVRCLVQGEIKGAGLDVFENEPNIPKELFEMGNVVLTAHQSVFTPEAISDVIQVCIANFEAFFAGKPLLTPVVAD